jgi:deazaflavin-dependent oxidoreductase (nitroreductase family)
MANWWWFTKLHRAVYRASGGRLGTRMLGLEMCLLTTRGRKSGLERTIPLACFPRGDDVVVVASNNGQDRDPLWWRNLQAHPEARVRIGARERRMRAHPATPEEREELLPWLELRNPFLTRHERKTSREIPIVILRPAEP